MRYGRELLLLLILCAVILIGSKYFKTSEGFNDEAKAQHNQFVKRQQKNYNQVGLALLAGQSVGNLGTDTRPVLGTVIDKVLPSGNVRPQMTNEYPLNDDKEGLYGIIKKCEIVNTEDCSKFDDPNFAKDCGICLDIGKDSNMKPKTGGLVVLERDRAYARKHKKRGNRLPEYAPTIGSCPANRLATTKAECLRVKKEKECQLRKDYNLPECSQCFADGTYFPVTSDAITTKELYIGGVGSATVTYGGNTSTMDLNATPAALEFDVKEGETFSVRVEPRTWNEKVRLYGYMQGSTQRGSFTIDLKRLVRVDGETGARVRTSGAINQFAIPLAIMSPGPGKRRMNLSIFVAMSFVDTDTIQGDMCPDGPFVTTRASAEFLESDPCYKKGTGPGSYTMECLQETFIGNGCTESGRNFPNDGSRMSTLLFDERGTARTIGDIANMIYEKAVETATGMTVTAQKMEIEDWSASSVFCTGRAITSPCDTPDQEQGPLRPECLDYLWQNMGDGKQVGATYYIGNPARSLYRSNDRSQFCQREGTLAPVGTDGVPNPTAMAYWKGILGGVEPVKRRMREIHDLANGEYSDAVKAQAVMQCYGQQLADRPVVNRSTCKRICGYKARYVRVISPNARSMWMQIAVIDSTGKNVALGKSVYASNTRQDMGSAASPDKVTDGNDMRTDFLQGVWWTDDNKFASDPENLLQIDLGAEYDVVRVVLQTIRGRFWSTPFFNDHIRKNFYNSQIIRLANNAGTVLVEKPVNPGAKQIDSIVVDFHTDTSADCLQCEKSDKEQVFAISRDDDPNAGPQYAVRREEAENVCRAVGARQATYAEVQKAQQSGSDVCFTGWVSDYGQAIFPNSNSIQQGCGGPSPGIKEYTPSDNKAGVYCYGMKPTGTGYTGRYHQLDSDGKKYSILDYKPGYYNPPTLGMNPGNIY
jgi:hypothetical protein